MKGSGRSYVLEIRAEAGETIPELTRLRSIIKSLLRCYSFKVMKLEPVADEIEHRAGIGDGKVEKVRGMG